MYISKLKIQNYRCFGERTIEFRPGVNVIVGENNAGKTALLSALGQVFNADGRKRPGLYDFFHGISDHSKAPSITIEATLTSSDKDTTSDKALVATWLTKIHAPWEARLTYRCFLPEKDAEQFKKDLGLDQSKKHFLRTLERALPKYVTRLYGGNSDDQIQVDGESLSKFQYQFVDALRDVKSTMFSGQNSLLKRMLLLILDAGADEETKKDRDLELDTLAGDMQTHVKQRLDLTSLFGLIEQTGAGDSGSLDLEGQIYREDLLNALRLYVEKVGLRLPVVHDGLGYNNLVYISLLLSKMDLESTDAQGENAIVFPLLVVEEPEAHLHPALQYRLLKYLRKRVREAQKSRQIFITTHSTQITSAASLDSIICLKSPKTPTESPEVAYPGRVFADDKAGKASKKYVDRYLDATKSNLLFARSVILVEGLAELLILPLLAESAGRPLEESHVALVSVGGSNFKHFLPLFGACLAENRPNALKLQVSCIVDRDPSRKANTKNARWKKCWPYEATFPMVDVEYKATSGVIDNLAEQISDSPNIKIWTGHKTFEYDLAYENPALRLLVTESCDTDGRLDAYCVTPAEDGPLFEDLDDEARAALPQIVDATERARARFATYCLQAADGGKGAHAFDLSVKLRDNLDLSPGNQVTLVLPDHLKQAIEFVTKVPQPAPANLENAAK